LVSLKSAIDVLVYLSVVLGVALLYQVYCAAPQWLFIAVLIGWLAYLVVAVLVASDNKFAHPLVFVMAIITLAGSLSSPEHFAFVQAGISLASLTFVIGSSFQIALIVLIPIYLFRKKSRPS